MAGPTDEAPARQYIKVPILPFVLRPIKLLLYDRLTADDYTCKPIIKRSTMDMELSASDESPDVSMSGIDKETETPGSSDTIMTAVNEMASALTSSSEKAANEFEDGAEAALASTDEDETQSCNENGMPKEIAEKLRKADEQARTAAHPLFHQQFYKLCLPISLLDSKETILYRVEKILRLLGSRTKKTEKFPRSIYKLVCHDSKRDSHEDVVIDPKTNLPIMDPDKVRICLVCDKRKHITQFPKDHLTASCRHGLDACFPCIRTHIYVQSEDIGDGHVSCLICDGLMEHEAIRALFRSNEQGAYIK